MRAIELSGGIGLEHLKVVERPDPKPGPSEVLVRMRAVSLNYRDLLMVGGVYGRATPDPMTPFSDGCGVVEAVGEGVSRVKVGDRVATLFFQKWLAGKPTPAGLASALGAPIPGVGRELATFHEDGVSKVPEFLTDNEVATLPCAALTAWRALFEDARLQPGDWVLLQGTGGVSIFGLQFAKAAGYRTIITSSSDDKLERARALGADQVINYKALPGWGRAAREITAGTGVAFVMEVGGASTLTESLAAIALGGHIAIIGVLGGASEPLSIGSMIGTGAKLQGVMVGSRAMFEAMCVAIETLRITPVVDKVLPFTEVVAAFEAMRAGQHFGKIVLTF
ncbi:MAG TPA: NAD(P)-dependent alcohol dehydrogenase [Caulobacteraceae bacterium]|jgi:NADPH:quinone reductase-like Zn-dependent oxidoreductase|nr:NAD(P)-dependent alcohol dehydrogenase [Caulobacteraceae bacterium]